MSAHRPAPAWIALLCAACCAAAGCGDAEPSSAGDARGVVLITLDTTRRDALSAFGGAAGTTPNLDRLAAESTVATWARSVAPITLVAHTSMLTGLYPPRHGVRTNGPARVPASARTLAEILEQAGWQTAAFVGSLALDKAFGLDQGFQTYDQPASRGDRAVGEISERRAGEVVERARAWLAARDRARPFFLWVHLFDPHAPYDPPEPFRSRAPTLYQGEVAAMDDAIGELVDDPNLDLDSVLLVVVGDHGEGLGEHDEPTHALLCYDTTLRVPFFVRRPHARDAGRTVAELVSVADVLPTVLAELGLALPGDLDGVPLQRAGAERGVYFETYQGWLSFGMSPLAGWADPAGKYVHGPHPELFRPAQDPGETRDFGADAGAELARYRSAIEAVGSAPKLAPDPARAFDERFATQLAALGYGPAVVDDSAPGPLADVGRPDPRQGLAAIAIYDRGFAALNAGRPRDAIADFESVVAVLPEHILALDGLTQAWMILGEWERAAEVARRRLAVPPSARRRTAISRSATRSSAARRNRGATRSVSSS
jgi:arylsulfatase A-like enzyme